MKLHFQKEQEDHIFPELKKEVSVIINTLAKRKRIEITAKAILFPLLYIITYLLALTFGDDLAVYYICYFLLGLLLVLNFLNLIHEAVHNTLFENRRLNEWYVHFFDLMGANSYIWKIRHTRLHHNYPNVMGWDSDIEQSPIARVFPHGPFSRFQSYQHIYLPLLYPLYLMNWLLVRDFKDFFNKKKIIHKVTVIPRIEYIKLFIFKAAFLFYTIVLPVLILKISIGQAIGAFLIMLFTASVISLFVLLSPHANTESVFPLPNDKGEMPTTWFMHQIAATNDVKEDNWFIRFFMGCFNYHVVHHLFPHVNHVYYPEINKVLEKYALQYDLPYRKLPILTSLKSHYKLLKSNRRVENIFEETM